jgi:hypothetical protein
MAGRATTAWRYEHDMTTYRSDEITSAVTVFSKRTKELIIMQDSYKGKAFFVLAAPAGFSAQHGAQTINIPVQQPLVL